MPLNARSFAAKNDRAVAEFDEPGFSESIAEDAPAADPNVAADPGVSDEFPNRPAADALPRSRAMTWDDYQNLYPGSGLTECADDPAGADDISLIEWWHEQSLVYRARNQRLVRPLVEDVLNPAVSTLTDEQKRQEFIARHTLPEEIAPETDVYDETPRLVSLDPEGATSAEVVPEEEQSRAVSRLQRRITDIQPTLSYAMRGIDEAQLPKDFYQQVESEEMVAQAGSPAVLHWAPTNFAHNPLYFEDPALERYGHTYHPLIQPFASTGRFATQLVGLPWQMTLHPIHAREYSLGWYRPGECAPKLRYQIPFNEEAAVMQIAAVAGLLLIFP